MFAVLLVSCSFITTASAKDYYVGKTGRDTNDGSAAHPWLTINHAASQIKPGDTVHVAPGTYIETGRTGYTAGVVTDTNGTPAAHIRFVSDIKWGAKVVGDGKSWSNLYFTIWDNRGNYTEIQGFDISGNFASIGIHDSSIHSRIIGNHVHDIQVPCRNSGGAGIDLTESGQAAHDAEVIGNVLNNIGTLPLGKIVSITRNKGMVTVVTNTPLYLEGFPGESTDHEAVISGVLDPSFNGRFKATDVKPTSFRYSQPDLANASSSGGTARTDFCTWVHGIYIQTPGGRIVNNIISNATGYGITNGGGGRNHIISNNLVFQNGAGGMGFGGVSSTDKWQDNTVTNNIAVDNGYSGIAESDVLNENPSNIGRGNKYLNNLVYQNFSAGFGSHGVVVCIGCGGLVQNTIAANPRFVNYKADGSGDYHLSYGSPAIGGGTPTTAAETDLDEISRPQNARHDVGPYEFKASRTPSSRN